MYICKCYLFLIIYLLGGFASVHSFKSNQIQNQIQINSKIKQGILRTISTVVCASPPPPDSSQRGVIGLLHTRSESFSFFLFFFFLSFFLFFFFVFPAAPHRIHRYIRDLCSMFFPFIHTLFFFFLKTSHPFPALSPLSLLLIGKFRSSPHGLCVCMCVCVGDKARALSLVLVGAECKV